MQKALPSPPLISNRRCNNLRYILVRAKHRRPPPKTPGAFRCNRSRWKTCPFYRRNHVSHLLLYLDEQRRIRHHISCSSSNLICMIQYNECNMQYLGETKRQLSDSFELFWRAPTLHRKSQKSTSLLSSYHRFRPLLPSR